MNPQGALPFSNPGTSREAAEAQRETARGKAAQVLAVIDTAHRAGSPGLTANEVEAITKFGIQTVTARIRGLVLAGFLVDTGLTRQARAGSRLRAIVWGPNTTGRKPPELGPRTHGRLAAALDRERERWRAKVAIAQSALESIEDRAAIATKEAAFGLPPLMRALGDIRKRAADAVAQLKALDNPPPVGMRRG